MDRLDKKPVLVVGSGKLIISICVCLLKSGHSVVWQTEEGEEVLETIERYTSDIAAEILAHYRAGQLRIARSAATGDEYMLSIVGAGENEAEKKRLLAELELVLPSRAVIALMSESVALSVLQEEALSPERLFLVNWAYPAHTTLFLELVANERSDRGQAGQLLELANTAWGKDAYLVCGERSMRARMISAMVREAFYLVSNGYASLEDIDRACRNDPGYYLPFAGNFRYMDLMGTSAYGMVMKDLNRELANDTRLPDFFTALLQSGLDGMSGGEGFYRYTDKQVEQWQETFQRFSHQISEIIRRYPFSYSPYKPQRRQAAV